MYLLFPRYLTFFPGMVYDVKQLFRPVDIEVHDLVYQSFTEIILLNEVLCVKSYEAGGHKT